MKTNIENTLLTLSSSVKTILVFDDESQRSFAEAPVQVLLDLINNGCEEEIVVFANGCGRALAYLAKLLNVKAIYALKMSEEAVAMLKTENIEYLYAEKTRLLMNDDDSDLDLYDKLTISLENEYDAHQAINKAVADMRIKEFWNSKRNNTLNYTAIIDISNGKCSVSSLYDSYGANNKRLPRKKDKMIGTDNHGMPIALLENIEINVTPLKNVDDDLASKEDKTLEEWRRIHIPLLYKEAEEIGIPANDDLWVLFEIFKKC